MTCLDFLGKVASVLCPLNGYNFLCPLVAVVEVVLVFVGGGGDEAKWGGEWRTSSCECCKPVRWVRPVCVGEPRLFCKGELLLVQVQLGATTLQKRGCYVRQQEDDEDYLEGRQKLIGARSVGVIKTRGSLV
ncbi:hypothetical protein E2542_SST26217 [Spatholobus suberectus]|nr:hypothetical protein E2542_SST26217 [Spatholobus suberectus]